MASPARVFAQSGAPDVHFPDAMAPTPLESYPLSPLQQGMLFHHLSEPGFGVDIEQLVCTLPEAVDAALLRDAWIRVAVRHDVLRTAFRWSDVTTPMQDVYAAVAIPFDIEDWRGLAAADVDERRRRFLREDRRRGFALDEAPLLRFMLIRVADARYELVWTFHHCILDGRSFPLVLEEVFSQYDALRRGEPLSLPPAPRYRDFIEWLGGVDIARAESFWRGRLAGFVAPTPLPTAFVTNDLSHSDGQQGERGVSLSEEATSDLGELARTTGVTLNTIVQGAWAILLARHSGESDVAFGTTRACRRSSVPDAESTVGLFINTLPMRVQVDDEAELGPWLKGVRVLWNELRAYEHTPLSAVKSWSAVPGGTPLFNSILVFENYLLNSSMRALGGKWANRTIQLHEQTNYPITLAVYGGVTLTLKLDYDRGRIDDATAERVLGHLAALLDGLAGATATQQLGELPWMTAAEHSLVVDEWNRTAREYERDASIPEVFAHQVRVRPDAVALEYRERTLTYRELDEAADQVAHCLRGLGIHTDVPVGLCLERSSAQIIGALGILKAGGAYLSLDPSYPADRLAFMLSDAGAPVVVTESALVGRLPIGPGSPVVVALDAAAPEFKEPLPGGSSGAADSLAYLIYTSGSTGVPKAVEATHRGVVRLVRSAGYAKFGPDEVVLSFAPLGFDASTFEIWGALLNGARLVLFPETQPTLEMLGEVIRDCSVTTLWLSAALFHQMVDGDIEGLRPLRQILAGGDVLSVPHVRRVLRELPSCQLINGYGPTENTTFTCCYPLPADWEDGDGARPGATVPIGRPVTNTTVYLLDSRMRPVPVGVTGRLYTGGDGLARGYRNRPDLTAERFIADPFSSCANARLYDSGDLALWRPDGTIEFRGRADRQLKIRGFRVEPGEVEAVLELHPAVGGVSVIGREDIAGDKRLVAYVVVKAGTTVGTDGLREFAAERLPAYLVPSHVVALDHLPLTSSGKVDRLRLPRPDATPDLEGRTYMAPRTGAEATLAGIWAATLRVERVGAYDNFFELGGDSLLIIQIVARARQAGLRLSVREFFRHPTVSALAATAVVSEPPGRRQDAVSGVIQLTPAERWFLEGEPEELHHWNQAFLFTVPAKLDTTAFGRALAQVTMHHDALRMRVRRDDTGWHKELAPAGDVPGVATADLSAVAIAKRNQAIESACLEAQRSLNIEHGPLVAVLHIVLGNGLPGRMFIAVHHLAVDGVSWRPFLEDLEAAYATEIRGAKTVFPPKTSSVKVWGERIEAYASSEAAHNELAYWESIRSGVIRALPRDLDNSDPDLEGDATTVVFTLDRNETVELLQRVPSAYNTHVNDALITALGLTLGAWMSEGTVVVDTEGHGREDMFDGIDLSRTVGWFTAIYPIRLKLPLPGNIGDALKQTKEQLRSIPHRGFTFGILRDVAREPSLAAEGDLVFNYLGQLDSLVAESSLFTFAPEPSGPWRGPRAVRHHRLEVNALVRNGQLEVRWSYNRRTHSGATIERLGQEFLAGLRAIVSHCTRTGVGGYTPSDFPLARLTQTGLDRVAAGARDIEDIYPLAPVQGLFLGYASSGDGDPGFEQWTYRLHGSLDTVALKQAWQAVVERHTIFRTSFPSEGLGDPLQIVRRRVELPWIEHDWRTVARREQSRRLEHLRVADRARGFQPTVAPLMRMTLIRLSADEYEFVWSHHHLLLDRWSWPIVLREVRSLYGGSDPRSLSSPPLYRDYVRWIEQQDMAATEAFWRNRLGTMRAPLTFSRQVAPLQAGPVEARMILPADQVATLRAVAAAWQVSVNTVILGAWVIWLGHEFAALDVVFGISVAGRPSELAGIDQMVGLTINNLPVRVRIDESCSTAEWLRALQAAQSEAQVYGYAPLDRIHGWSRLPWRQRLFDTLVVFQNSTADDETRDWLGPGIRIDRRDELTRTGYPLSLVVLGTESLSLALSADVAYFLPEFVESALERVRSLVFAMGAGPSTKLGSLLGVLPINERGRSAAPSIPERPGPTRDLVAPRTAAESVMARLWGELLGTEPVGIFENFFTLGGHSLLALHLAARVGQTFRVGVPVSALFRNPTVEGLTRAIAALEARPGQVERIAEIIQRVESMSLEQLNTVALPGPQGD